MRTLSLPDRRPDLARALTGRPREIPTRYLYDARGAALFEAIVALPEYYQARTEAALLRRHADALVADVAPRSYVELGVGSGDKTRTLLAPLARLGGVRNALVQDVHAGSATRAAMRLDRLHPEVDVRAAAGDFLEELPAPPPGPRLFALLGSTFGNLGVDASRDLLERLAALAGPDDAFLLGVDLAHDREALVRAYDDARGVTATFNRNALAHLNRVASADFALDGFRHEARFDEATSRIEMHLEATRPMRVQVRSIGLTLELARGERLRTEISEKHTEASLARRLVGTGWRIARFLTDARERYALALLTRTAGAVGRRA